MSLRGNCRTESDFTACSPAIKITRLTTMARTGRRMNRSVNFIVWSAAAMPPLSCRSSRAAAWPPHSTLTVFRPRLRAVGRLDGVVDDDGGPRPQLEDAGGDDLLARLHPADDADLVAAAAGQFHELLAYAAIALARLRVLHILDDVNGVAERRVADGRGGEGDDVRRAAAGQPRLHEHAGAELAVGVVEDRLHAHVARA